MSPDDFDESDTGVHPVGAPALPFGCIQARHLRQLATAMQKLAIWHAAYEGKSVDMPCLRRVEASTDTSGKPIIVAHISTGPAVGGTWVTLMLSDYGWKFLEE